MSFPHTRHSLIQRIAAQGSEDDWREFVADYWGPVHRFARRQGALTNEDAEDVASLTFEVIVRNELLPRWVSHRSAKLRTLMCTVVRNIVANLLRVRKGRARLLRERLAEGDPSMVSSQEPSVEEIDTFYTAWVEDILQQSVESLMVEYHKNGKGDYFRVLHGRLCEGMTTPQIASALEIKTSAAENYYKHARKMLAGKLEELVRSHVLRYCPEKEMQEEFESEWGKLGDYLKDHGGLEEIVRRTYEGVDPISQQESKSASMSATSNRVTEILRLPAQTQPPHE